MPDDRAPARTEWLVATVQEIREESAAARTITLDVADWPGHVAGQHLDLRLRSADGCSPVRSYWLASAADGPVEVTVVEVAGGAVSPYLVRSLCTGEPVEVRGPLGGPLVWRPGLGEPVQLVGADAGVVPLVAMLRTRSTRGDTTPMRLIYAVQRPGTQLYADELPDLTADGRHLQLHWTRAAPAGSRQRPGALDADALEAASWPASVVPTVYVCGPSGFVDHVGGLLLDLGHDVGRIRTERL